MRHFRARAFFTNTGNVHIDVAYDREKDSVLSEHPAEDELARNYVHKVLTPAEAEEFAYSLLDAIRLAEGHSLNRDGEQRTPCRACGLDGGCLYKFCSACGA